ncbi:MAG: hypothetical protein ACT4NX_02155 [Deltaproteobacteria bacterium]
MCDFFKTKKDNLDYIDKIKKWVALEFELPQEASIMVTEVKCEKPDCPPHETVIAILDTPPRRYKLMKGIKDVRHLDVAGLAEGEKLAALSCDC